MRYFKLFASTLLVHLFPTILLFIFFGTYVSAGYLLISTGGFLVLSFWCEALCLFDLKPKKIGIQSNQLFFQNLQHLAHKIRVKCPEVYELNRPHHPMLLLQSFQSPGSIVLTKDFLKTLKDEEINSILAYSLCSLKNRDVFFRSYLALLATIIQKGMDLFFYIPNKLKILRTFSQLVNFLYVSPIVGFLNSVAGSRKAINQIVKDYVRMGFSRDCLGNSLEKLKLMSDEQFFDLNHKNTCLYLVGQDDLLNRKKTVDALNLEYN